MLLRSVFNKMYLKKSIPLHSFKYLKKVSRILEVQMVHLFFPCVISFVGIWFRNFCILDLMNAPFFNIYIFGNKWKSELKNSRWWDNWNVIRRKSKQMIVGDIFFSRN